VIKILPELVEPTSWTLCFHRTTPHWWLRLLPGPYKHVSAFAFVPALKLWVLYDVRLNRTVLALLPDCEAVLGRLADHSVDADCVTVRVQPGTGRHLMPAFYCVPALCHLLNLPCVALTPGGLYRHLRKHGGIPYGRTESTTRGPCDQAGPGGSQAPENAGYRGSGF